MNFIKTKFFLNWLKFVFIIFIFFFSKSFYAQCGTPVSIGDSFQGGIVGYILQVGDPGYDANVQKGLVAAPTDQSGSWGCSGTVFFSGAAAIGTGNQNTINIDAGCTTPGIAADLCANLTLGSYSDWYLPSKDELNKLYINRVAIGGFSSGYYWSSTDQSTSQAWLQRFATGGQSTFSKSGRLILFRPVRSFSLDPLPTATAGGALASICQGSTSAIMNGSVGGGATGGTWSGGAGTWTDPTDVANARYTADVSESGSITLTLTTSGGSCGSVLATKSITVTSIPSINAGSDQVVCHGSSFTLSSLASSGTIPYNYSWSNGNNNASFTSNANYLTWTF